MSQIFSVSFFLVFKLQTPQASDQVGDHQHSEIHSKAPDSLVYSCLACSILLYTTAIDEDSMGKSRIKVPLSGRSECTHRIQSILLIDFEQSPLLMCQPKRLPKNCQDLHSPFVGKNHEESLCSQTFYHCCIIDTWDSISTIRISIQNS